MRRTINIIIIAIATLLAGFSQALLLPVVIIFMAAFNIICLIYYRKTRLIIAFHVVNIFLISGFFVRVFNLVPDQGILLLFSAFMDVGSFALFFVTFGILLQNKIEKRVERAMMFVTIYYIIFYTLTRFQIINYLNIIFSPVRADMLQAVQTFFIINYVFIGIVGIVQVYLIIKFDEYKTRDDYREQKRLQEIENMFY